MDNPLQAQVLNPFRQMLNDCELFVFGVALFGFDLFVEVAPREILHDGVDEVVGNEHAIQFDDIRMV